MEEPEKEEPEKKKNPQLRNWCWTLHAPTELEIAMLMTENLDIRYICWQQELTKKDGLHLQGYVQLKEKMVLNTVKKIMMGDKKSRIHLEGQKGTVDEARQYCTPEKKEDRESIIPGTFFERGILSRAGKSNELTEVAEKVSKQEMTIDQVMEESPTLYVMYGKGLEALAVNTMPDRDREIAPEVLWYYGPTGTGKSRKAWDENPGLYVWSGQWPFFNGYRGQETVLFDDFRGTIPFSMFLRLLDRYPMSVDTKGGYMKWRAKKIIVTSALHWEDVYNKELLHAEDKIAQLKRRISETVVFR